MASTEPNRKTETAFIFVKPKPNRKPNRSHFFANRTPLHRKVRNPAYKNLKNVAPFFSRRLRRRSSFVRRKNTTVITGAERSYYIGVDDAVGAFSDVAVRPVSARQRQTDRETPGDARSITARNRAAAMTNGVFVEA